MKTTTILAPREAHNTHANDTAKGAFLSSKNSIYWRRGRKLKTRWRHVRSCSQATSIKNNLQPKMDCNPCIYGGRWHLS